MEDWIVTRNITENTYWMFKYYCPALSFHSITVNLIIIIFLGRSEKDTSWNIKVFNG